MSSETGHELISAGLPIGHSNAASPAAIRRAIAASVLGNASECFDCGIYVSYNLEPHCSGEPHLHSTAD